MLEVVATLLEEHSEDNGHPVHIWAAHRVGTLQIGDVARMNRWHAEHEDCRPKPSSPPRSTSQLGEPAETNCW